MRSRKNPRPPSTWAGALSGASSSAGHLVFRVLIAAGALVGPGLLEAGRAHAAQFSVDPMVGAGYADVAAPSAVGGTSVTRVKDEFLSFGLSARLRLNGALMAQTLGYSLFATEYLGATIPSNIAQGVNWQLTGTPTGKTQLVVAVLAGRSSSSSAAPVDVMTGSTTSAPLGSTTQVSAGLNESFSYAPTGTQNYAESAGVFLSRVSGATNITSLQLTGALAAQRIRGRNTYSLNAQGTTASFLSVESGPAGRSADPGTILTAQLLAGWDKEHSATLSTSVRGGAMILARPRYDQVALGPAFTAALNYASFPWFAALTVFQQPSVNLFVGNAVIADGISLRVSLPLSRRYLWTVSGLAGYTYGRAVAPHKGLIQYERGYDLVTFGATTTYVFQRYPVFISLNYLGSSQRGSNLKEFPFPNSARSLLWLSVGASFAWGEGSHGFLRQ